MSISAYDMKDAFLILTSDYNFFLFETKIIYILTL